MNLHFIATVYIGKSPVLRGWRLLDRYFTGSIFVGEYIQKLLQTHILGITQPNCFVGENSAEK